MPGNWNRYAHMRIRRTAVLKLSVIALIAGFVTCLTAGGAFAATSYAPPPPPVTVPGGYTAVVTSVTVGPAGGTVGPAPCNGGLVTVTVPAGAFASPVQITVTCPSLSGITPLPHFTDDIGVGVQVTTGGTPFPGTFMKPLTATMAKPDITAASVGLVWNGTAFVTDPDTTVVAGAASIGFDSDPDFVVESPTVTVVVTHPLVPVTGEPFLGEGIVAGVLVLGGTGGVFMSRRRRTQV
jgi:hypothetical protein